MNNLPEIQTTLKKLIADGANYGLKKLEEVLKPGTERYNDFIQIQGRYKNYLNAVIKGIASKAELDLQYNQITQALIYFADSICEEDLIQEEEPQESGPKRGELLYHVPPAMQTGQEHKCAVRVAYTKDAIVEDWEVQEGDVEKSIPVAEVMSVELLNVDESQPFAIRTFSDTIQYLDNDYFTEWEFYVKPLRHGSFPLLLKISMIETRNGREVKRNVVIEEHVVVSTEPVEEQAPEMKPANVSLDFGGAAPAGSPERRRRRLDRLFRRPVAGNPGVVLGVVALHPHPARATVFAPIAFHPIRTYPMSGHPHVAAATFVRLPVARQPASVAVIVAVHPVPTWTLIRNIAGNPGVDPHHHHGARGHIDRTMRQGAAGMGFDRREEAEQQQCDMHLEFS
ncbi:MAG TPA: hypothetical protein PKY30_05045 [Myxococcota bacterium]|nr:hypothetical protein [Myxococcota bacterium]